MTARNITRRLRRIENRNDFSGHVATASDVQLIVIVRGAYAGLRAELGGLRDAASHLRGTREDGDAAFATLIEEDMEAAMRGAIKIRLAKVEWRLFSRTCGIHLYAEYELAGLIAVLCQAEVGEAINRVREEWAFDLLHLEGLLP